MVFDALRNEFARWSASRQKCPSDHCTCECANPEDPHQAYRFNNGQIDDGWLNGSSYRLRLPVPPLEVSVDMTLIPVQPGGVQHCHSCCKDEGGNPIPDDPFFDWIRMTRNFEALYSDDFAKKLSFTPYPHLKCGGWNGSWVFGEIETQTLHGGGTNDVLIGRIYHENGCTDLNFQNPSLGGNRQLSYLGVVSCGPFGGLTMTIGTACVFDRSVTWLQSEECSSSFLLLPDQCIYDCGYVERDSENNFVLDPKSGGPKLIYNSKLRNCSVHPVCRCSSDFRVAQPTQCTTSLGSADPCWPTSETFVKPATMNCVNGVVPI